MPACIGQRVPDRTILDFGEQWTRYPDNDGYYASVSMLADILEPLLPVADLKNRRVMEIGSGSGRIAGMLLEADASQVIAVEPSAAMDALEQNLRGHADRLVAARVTGDQAPDFQADIALSIGVLHHIPEPVPVVRRVFDVLKPGGQFLFWVYGHEGNELYLRVFEPLRRVTSRLPDRALDVLCHGLNAALVPYIELARIAPVPMRHYAVNVLGKLERHARFLVIFDQLNPQHASYYRREEALALMRSAGFVDVRIHHRHGYSWTVIGRKPER